MRLLLTLFIFLLSSRITYSQKLNERIQGQWICDQIVAPNGNISPQNELMPSGYLRYSFRKNKVIISDAPFNIGSTLLVNFSGENSLLFYSEHVEKKSVYNVKLLNNDKLILTATSENGEPVDFNFTKLNLSFDGLPIDNGLIVIEHFKKSQKAKVTMRSSYYVYNDTVKWKILNKHSKRGPTFKDGRFGDFDNFLTENFTFPNDYKLNEFSEELIIDFDITNNEIKNIKIIKGLRKDIDNVVISLIQKTARKWSLPELDDNPNNLTLRFHFKFLLGLYDPKL